MQPHASLLALVALLAFAHARSASIQQISPELEKKLAEVVEEAIKDQKPIEIPKPVPTENLSSEPTHLDQPNVVKDVDNNLRKVSVPEIPVKVVVEDVASQLNTEPVKNEVVPENDSLNVMRAEPDLQHPGEPQQQQHETQGPPKNEESHILTDIKKAIAETQTTFNQGFSEVSKNLQDFFAKNVPLTSIQETIQDFQDKFRGQVEKINISIKNIMLPESENIVETEEKEKKLKKELEGVESTLKKLENNFDKGINTLSNGIQVFAEGKAEGEGQPKPPTETVQPAPPAAGSNPFASILQAWNNIVNSSMTTLTQTFNQQSQQSPTDNTATQSGIFNIGNLFGGGQPAPAPGAEGSQSDEAANNRPSLLQNLQTGIQNLLNPQGQVQADTQQSNQPQPNRPFQALQNNIVQGLQGITNLFNPNRPPVAEPAKPVQATQPIKPVETPQPEKPVQAANEVPKPEASVDTVPEGSNVVPVNQLESEDKKPVAAEASVQKPASEVQKPVQAAGPIQQLNQQIQKNPIVRGIAGAVQRLQHTISNNPDQPRDALAGHEAAKEEPAKLATEKGHKHGFGSSSGSSNDSSDSDSKRIEEKIQPEPVKAAADSSLSVKALAEEKEVKKEGVVIKEEIFKAPDSQVIKTE